MTEINLTATELTDEDKLRLAQDAKRNTEIDFERVKLANPDDPRLAEFKDKHERLKKAIKDLEPQAKKASKGS